MEQALTAGVRDEENPGLKPSAATMIATERTFSIEKAGEPGHIADAHQL